VWIAFAMSVRRPQPPLAAGKSRKASGEGTLRVLSAYYAADWLQAASA
jgi:hypothetical protein